MAHTVFICHSSKDKAVADAACAALEAQRIRCWIAPRDVLGGTEYMEELELAIRDCQIMLFIFSQKSNDSVQVRREIERAVSYEKIIVPFRIDATKPAPAIKYALSNTHWLDALTPPLEHRLTELCDTVRRLIARHTIPTPLWQSTGSPIIPREVPEPLRSAPNQTSSLNTPAPHSAPEADIKTTTPTEWLRAPVGNLVVRVFIWSLILTVPADLAAQLFLNWTWRNPFADIGELIIVFFCVFGSIAWFVYKMRQELLSPAPSPKVSPEAKADKAKKQADKAKKQLIFLISLWGLVLVAVVWGVISNWLH